MNNVKSEQIDLRRVHMIGANVVSFAALAIPNDYSREDQVDAGVILQILDLPFQLVGQIPVVVVEHAEELAGGGMKAGVTRLAQSLRGLVTNQVQPGVGNRQSYGLI